MTRIVENRDGIFISVLAAEVSTGFADAGRIPQLDAAGLIDASMLPGGGGGGSVTTVSVVTAAGVSGSVANPTTTPAITIALGAITPTSVAASGAVTGSNLSGTHSGASSGTNTGDQTTVSGNAGTATALASARNFSISGGGITAPTVAFDGTGAVVLVPTLGAITPTSVAASGTVTGSNLSGSSSGTNTGDQTSIVGISGTKAQFNTACSDGDFVFQSDIGTLGTKIPLLDGVNTWSGIQTYSAQQVTTMPGHVSNPTIYMNGATNNWIACNTNGLGAPTFTTRSAGVKFCIYPSVAGASADVAIGLEAAGMWLGVDTTASNFKFYGGTTLAVTFSGTGNITAVGTVAGTNITTGGNTTGNSATTTALATGRNFSLSGGGITSATVSFNGSGDVVLVPVVGAITPSSVACTGIVSSSSASAGVGYATGAGGTISQTGGGANKTTGVTLNTVTGLVTMQNTALAAATIVSHTLTNSRIAATDIVVLEHVSGGTSGAYTLNAFPAAGSAVISLRNNTAGSLSEAVVYRFAIIKSVNA